VATSAAAFTGIVGNVPGGSSMKKISIKVRPVQTRGNLLNNHPA
jgi:hypothetical protein